MAFRATTWRFGTLVRSTLAAHWRDLLGVVGAGALLYGLALIYPPAAWIVGGCLAIFAGVRA